METPVDPVAVAIDEAMTSIESIVKTFHLSEQEKYHARAAIDCLDRLLDFRATAWQLVRPKGKE